MLSKIWKAQISSILFWFLNGCEFESAIEHFATSWRELSTEDCITKLAVSKIGLVLAF